MLNFHHGFVPHAADILRTLYQALAEQPCLKTLEWTNDTAMVFTSAKNAMHCKHFCCNSYDFLM